MSNEYTANAEWQNHMNVWSNKRTEDESVVYNRTNASYIQNGGGATGRPDYNRGVYEHYRPSDSVNRGNSQKDLHEIMSACHSAYENEGIIKSTIDMMSEFGAEGIEIVHPDASVQNFYNNWAKQVHLEDRVERFLSWFYKSGNTVVRRRFGVLNKEDIKRMRKVLANENITPSKDIGRIPIGYTFYNPAHVKLVGDKLGSLSSKQIYTIKVPLTGFRSLKNSKNPHEQEVYNGLPEEIKEAVNGKSSKAINAMEIVIPEDKVFVAHYKKDDTEIWAKSFIHSILSDVYYNDKLKLAKTTALDGIINVIRLWKLGDHTATPAIYPDENLSAKLADILSNNIGGGSMDLIWNSAIELEEFYPPIEKLVNFKENHHQILLGLGVPEALVGGSETKAGIGNNTIGLKNFIKRLETGRRAIREWLQEEIDIIHKNMNFKRKPYIRFANADLHDERTYYNLLIQLADRNIISQDRVLELIDELPEIEKSRVFNEEEQRDNGVRPEKASPYHNPQLSDQHDHEIDRMDKQSQKLNSNNESKKKETRTKTKGRPPGSQDKVTRKRGEDVVRSSADLFLQAHKVYDFVEAFTTRTFLSNKDLKDVRKLTAAEKIELERVKDILLPLVSPYETLNKENVLKVIANHKDETSGEFNRCYHNSLKESVKMNLSHQDKKILKINAYLVAWGIKEYE